ncbi:hypothetical protein SAY87_006883 [Trapa incisa]|uniref:Uncharacterized protein n=1 Tax=Trapa incisa TaxID=236973 RepID=A0AAN7JZK5_9MYRT|nr:hypothetical protein SAY87_006883 [Trapa incisa]
MNKKFGGGRAPTGTPSLALSCAVVIASLLAGASVVHNIYKPNLVRVIHCFLSSMVPARKMFDEISSKSLYLPFTLMSEQFARRFTLNLKSLCRLCLQLKVLMEKRRQSPAGNDRGDVTSNQLPIARTCTAPTFSRFVFQHSQDFAL